MAKTSKESTLEAIILQHYPLISQLALAVMLTLITILALLPIETIPSVKLTFWQLPVAGDKIAHGVAFVVISGLLDAFLYREGFNFKKVVITALYGVYLEALQSLTDYRHPSFWDMVANCVGILIYWLLIPAWKITPVLRTRWLRKHQET